MPGLYDNKARNLFIEVVLALDSLGRLCEKRTGPSSTTRDHCRYYCYLASWVRRGHSTIVLAHINGNAFGNWLKKLAVTTGRHAKRAYLNQIVRKTYFVRLRRRSSRPVGTA